MQVGKTLHPKELALFKLEPRVNGDEGLSGVPEDPEEEKLAVRLRIACPPGLLIGMEYNSLKMSALENLQT